MLNIEDANSHTTSFTYDAFGRVTETSFPSTHYEQYAYDAANNLISKTDRKGQTINYVYDDMNRLTQKTYPDSTSVEYVYDLVGEIRQVTDPTGTYGFAYDNMGRLVGTTTQYTFLPLNNFTNSYTYDADSNRLTLTDPQGGVTSYAYDTLNRLSTLTPPTAFSSTGFGFTYDALSRRTQMTRPNGVTTNYTYDNLSHLLSVLHQVSASTIDGAAYTYDSAGNRTAKTNELSAVASNYTYDPLYELTQVTQATNTTESYSYDSVGNRLSSLGVSSYSNNSSNELTSTSAASYAYDANGNTTSKTVSGNTTNYTWDYENRLTSAVLPGTGGTVAFKYDPFDRRIYKSSSSATSIYAYDGDNLIEETNSSGAVVARYTQNLGIDDPLAMLRSSTTSYYHSDALGSVTSLSNGAGALAQTYSFDSFGKTTPTGSLVNPFQYTGREFDTETNLYFFRARYLDPSTGRFINEDFLRLPDGLSRYDYALNSAVNYVDPFGLCPWQVRQRPLKGGVGNAVKNLADPPPSHKYFYNPITGQSAGLGPAKNPPIYNPGKEVPGKWEPPEDPSKNPDDSLTGQVPDALCDCVDKKAKNPGAPPDYCALGKPHLGQAPCTNCWNWVVGILKECSDEQNQQQNKH